MAIAAATVWEVQTGGSDSNGGGFVTGAAGTDRSQQTAAQATLSVASVVHTTTTQINVAAGDFTVSAADVGNILQITGGTATAGFYQITVADVPNNRWTLDRSAGTAAQTVVGAMGGCLLTPGKAAAAASVAGNTVYQKAGTYTITSASTNISGGCVSLAVRVNWEGYQTTRGDLGTKPLLQASGISTFALISLVAHSSIVTNVSVDGAGLTSSRGIQQASAGHNTFIYKCHAANCTNSGFSGVSSNVAIFCSATGCSTQAAFQGLHCMYCEAYANTSVAGFNTSTIGVAYIGCISYGNTGATGHGFMEGATGFRAIDCVAYGNGGNGFDGDNGAAVVGFFNCIAEGNSAYGFSVTASAANYLINCATFDNTSGAILNTPAMNIGQITGTGSFFTNAAGGDFTLNNTAGGGALLRAAAFPALFPAGLTANYADIGAAQHLEVDGGRATYVLGI